MLVDFITSRDASSKSLKRLWVECVKYYARLRRTNTIIEVKALTSSVQLNRIDAELDSDGFWTHRYALLLCTMHRELLLVLKTTQNYTFFEHALWANLLILLSMTNNIFMATKRKIKRYDPLIENPVEFYRHAGNCLVFPSNSVVLETENSCTSTDELHVWWIRRKQWNCESISDRICS